MNGNEIMGLKNLKEHYKIKGVVSNYEKLRFFSLSGRVQHNREIFIINKIIEQINPKFLSNFLAIGTYDFLQLATSHEFVDYLLPRNHSAS